MKLRTPLKLVRVFSLIPHEMTNEKRFQKLFNKIRKNEFIKPIVVDINSLVILDGHHRVKAIKTLGYKNIPVYLVNYKNRSIKVFSRRKNYNVNKKEVITRGINKNLYPPKTTRHRIDGLRNWKIPLNLLDVDRGRQ